MYHYKSLKSISRFTSQNGQLQQGHFRKTMQTDEPKVTNAIQKLTAQGLEV